MKICTHCQSTTFDDMELCFDCMHYFEDTPLEASMSLEPSVARLKVVLTGYFSYELLLQKLEGRSVSIGSSSENAIVIPQDEVAHHHMEVFFARGHLWAESIEVSTQNAEYTLPVCEPLCIKPGDELKVGDASITVLEV